MQIFKNIAAYLDALHIPHDGVEDLFVFRIEDYTDCMPKEMEAFRKDFFQVTFGMGHHMDIKVGAASYTPIQSMLSFATPYHVKSWKVNAIQPNAVSYMVLFQPSALQPSYRGIDLFKNYQFFNLNSKPAISLSEAESTEMKNLMQTLASEFKNGTTPVVSAYLSIILEKTNTYFKSPNAKIMFSNRAEEIAFQFENLLKEYSNYRLRLGDYAEMLHISTAYLSEAVKKATGKSAKAITTEILILNAKALLTQYEDTIAAIAERLGFYDVSNFVKFFKKNTGYTPKAFQKLTT